jgi:p38 MAP kinase
MGMIDLLEKLLVYDPQSRVTATAALAHSYLEPYHDADDEPVSDKVFMWNSVDTNATTSIETWKIMMYGLSECWFFFFIAGSDHLNLS